MRFAKTFAFALLAAALAVLMGAPLNVEATPPTLGPTKSPTTSSTKAPSKSPTRSPTKAPSKSPSVSPTLAPSASPTLMYCDDRMFQAAAGTTIGFLGIITLALLSSCVMPFATKKRARDLKETEKPEIDWGNPAAFGYCLCIPVREWTTRACYAMLWVAAAAGGIQSITEFQNACPVMSGRNEPRSYREGTLSANLALTVVIFFCCLAFLQVAHFFYLFTCGGYQEMKNNDKPGRRRVFPIGGRGPFKLRSAHLGPNNNFAEHLIGAKLGHTPNDDVSSTSTDGAQ